MTKFPWKLSLEAFHPQSLGGGRLSVSNYSGPCPPPPQTPGKAVTQKKYRIWYSYEAELSDLRSGNSGKALVFQNPDGLCNQINPEAGRTSWLGTISKESVRLCGGNVSDYMKRNPLGNPAPKHICRLIALSSRPCRLRGCNQFLFFSSQIEKQKLYTACYSESGFCSLWLDFDTFQLHEFGQMACSSVSSAN